MVGFCAYIFWIVGDGIIDSFSRAAFGIVECMKFEYQFQPFSTWMMMRLDSNYYFGKLWNGYSIFIVVTSIGFSELYLEFGLLGWVGGNTWQAAINTCQLLMNYCLENWQVWIPWRFSSPTANSVVTNNWVISPKFHGLTRKVE